jgi:hypothetical protein
MAGSAPVRTEVDAYQYPVHASYAATVAAAAGTQVIKAGPGRLCSITVTATGTGLIVVYDNATAASGTILAALTVSPGLGMIPVDLPAFNGITVSAPTSSPAVTIGYS